MSVTSTLPASLSANQKLREVHHWINGESSTSKLRPFWRRLQPRHAERFRPG